MNDRERAICARVKELRERIGLSESDFARLIGVSRNQIAGVEYGRTPLRFELAKAIRALTGASLEWLSTGEVCPDSSDSDWFWQAHNDPKKTALLSDVFPAGRKKPKRPPDSPPLQIDQKEIAARSFATRDLKELAEMWMGMVPDGHASDLHLDLAKFALRWIKALPEDSSELINARIDALMWDRMRYDVARRAKDLAGWKVSGRAECKEGLDNVNPASQNHGVKTKICSWPALTKALRHHLGERGKKAALARKLHVSRQAVDQWLSGDAKPSAELTFALLQWVEQQERQK